mgnify:FL=1
MIELLSPVGDFDCLKAAVQNGADSVYFGANLFSARAFAHNFDNFELKKAIEYAKLRGVKTNLTLNTLIKDNEFDDAIKLASKAYEYGIDAIIIQDLGLAKKLMELFPDLPLHASTQMTIHNLEGALKLQKLGFKRIVLSRELSITEIEYICKNTSVEIECFVHGALCISYSGQCLFSSLLGGRSGNRGKCAGPCRLPYKLVENDKIINSGYLLSTKDLCGIDFLPSLINAGVDCLKIEGRMKSPEYVATVTNIYRKYIDLAYSGNDFSVADEDRKNLLQVFNRGNFSNGHLENSANTDLVYKEKPNNMGLFIGNIQKYNANKGHITLKIREPLNIGDTISIENETGSYTISELMDKKQNIKETSVGQLVTIGRMKGNIKVGDKVYRLSSKELTTNAKESFRKENRKIYLDATVSIKRNEPISISVTSCDTSLKLYKNLKTNCTLDYIPETAKNRPLDAETILKQISKTSSTPYAFKNIKIDLDDNLFLPKLSVLNELRRTALTNIEDIALSKIHRPIAKTFLEYENKKCDNTLTSMRNLKNKNRNASSPKLSLLLNVLHDDWNYNKLENIDSIYIPLKYFTKKKYSPVLKIISKKFDTYIYMPTIIKSNYKNLFLANAENAVQKYNIQGFVISNIGNLNLLNNLFNNVNEYYKIIANYTFNIYNSQTVLELKKLGISSFTLSPELDQSTIEALCNYNYLQKELIVYGKVPLLNINYCLLGNTNKCYPACSTKCQTNNSYFLRDRLNMDFEILTDNIQTVTTIYNSKITSIPSKFFNTDSVRVDILHESIPEINAITSVVKDGKRIEGKDYTSGNLNKEI